MKKSRFSKWPLFLIGLAAAGLVAARMIWPTLLFDSVSLILFGVAAMALLFGWLPLKRIKWGEFELERDVDAFEQRVIASERAEPVATQGHAPSVPSASATAPSPATGPTVSAAAPVAAAHPSSALPSATKDATPEGARPIQFDEWVSLVNSPASNVEKIISAGILLEKVLQATAESFGLAVPPSVKGARALLDRFVAAGMLKDEAVALREFWNLRNKVVHQGLRPTDEQTARVLDLLWRLARTLADVSSLL